MLKMFKKIVNDEIESLKKRQLKLDKELEELDKSIMEDKYKIVRYTYGNGKKRYTYLIDGKYESFNYFMFLWTCRRCIKKIYVAKKERYYLF